MDSMNGLSSWSRDQGGTKIDGRGLVDLGEKHVRRHIGASNKWEALLSHANAYARFPAQKRHPPTVWLTLEEVH